MKQEFFTVIPQNMREYKISIREADNENDLFRIAFDEVMKDHGLNTDGYMLAWDSFKDGWEAAVRLLNDDGERIDGRTAGTAGAEPENVQWWLASVDQYGNATLVDGAHDDMAGANKAAFLFDRMGLTNGRKLAAAKVELYEPKPSADGVNMDAVRECNRVLLAAAPSPQSPAGGEGQA